MWSYLDVCIKGSDFMKIIELFWESFMGVAHLAFFEGVSNSNMTNQEDFVTPTNEFSKFMPY